MSEPQQMSRINQLAALRVNGNFGSNVLAVFLQMEAAMNEVGGSSFTGNISFMEPGDNTQPGELIPTMHFSLQPYVPTLSVPIELAGDEDDRDDNDVPNGADSEE